MARGLPAPQYFSGRDASLAAQAQTFDKVLITGLVFAFDIIQKLPARRDHLQQTTAAVVVFFVNLEVLGQCGNAVRKNGNLNFGRTSVAVFGAEFFHHFCFFFSSNRHRGLLRV